MAFKIQGKVDGLGGVLKSLSGVAAKVRKKILRKAVTKAGGLMLKRAKQLVPVETKLLKKSLGRKVKVYPNTGTAVAVVGPRTGFRREVVRDGRKVLGNPVKYAHLVELGTRHSQAKPFLAPAVSGIQASIRKVMAAEIGKGLADAAKSGSV